MGRETQNIAGKKRCSYKSCLNNFTPYGTEENPLCISHKSEGDDKPTCPGCGIETAWREIEIDTPRGTKYEREQVVCSVCEGN